MMKQQMIQLQIENLFSLNWSVEQIDCVNKTCIPQHFLNIIILHREKYSSTLFLN